MPSMFDVAKLAGVSHQTVSRAINKPETVRPEHRLRIAAAINQLGYRRNLSARALVTKQTRNLGLVDSGSAILGHASMSMAIETAARERGYATIVAIVAPKTAPDMISAAFSHLMDQGVEGIIVLASTTNLVAASRRVSARVPVVMVASGARLNERLNVVGVRQEHGARIATRHLIEQGCTRIAHLPGPTTWLDAGLRVRGWRKELASADLPAVILGRGDWTARSGYRLGLELKAADLPDAVFVANDQMALGFLRAMYERGIRIPEDISVVGFDDLADSEYFCPPLSTVRQPFTEVGHAAIGSLLRAIDGRHNEPDEITPELIVRRSSRRRS